MLLLLLLSFLGCKLYHSVEESYEFSDILMQYSKGKSALVFCSTRKGAQEAAQKLAQTAMTYGYSNPFIKSREQLERLREASPMCSDKQMQSYILQGGMVCFTLLSLLIVPLLQHFLQAEQYQNVTISWLSQWWALPKGPQPRRRALP